MSYEINKKLSIINYTDASRKKGDIKYIVLHWVGAVSTALNNVIYFQNQYIGASSHFFCDKTSIWQSVLEEDIAWHVGANSYIHPYCRNSNAIGIEMCLESDWTIAEETLKRTIWLVQKLMFEYKIPIANVLRHYDVTGKSCPGTYLDNGKWEGLKKRFLNDNKVSPPQQGQIYRVRKSWDDVNSQLGAYKDLENAKAECDKHSGYSVFDSKGDKVYPLPYPTPEVPKEPEKTSTEDNIPKWQKDAFNKLVERTVIYNPEVWENRLGEPITIGEVMGMLANMI